LDANEKGVFMQQRDLPSLSNFLVELKRLATLLIVNKTIAKDSQQGAPDTN